MRGPISVIAATSIAATAPLSDLAMPPDTPMLLRAALVVVGPALVGGVWWAMSTGLRWWAAGLIGDARAKRARATQLLSNPDCKDDVQAAELLRDAEISEERAKALGRQIDSLPPSPKL